MCRRGERVVDAQDVRAPGWHRVREFVTELLRNVVRPRLAALAAARVESVTSFFRGTDVGLDANWIYVGSLHTTIAMSVYLALFRACFNGTSASRLIIAPFAALLKTA